MAYLVQGGPPPDDSVTTVKLVADAVDGTKIADNAVDSEHYTDGSIDLAHLSADAVDGTKIADNAIDSEHYTDGSIDNAHIADDAIDSEHYATGSIDAAHLADDAVTLVKMAGGVDGNLISYDTSGNPVAVAAGNDGQVLTSAGAGAVCLFEDAAAGGTDITIATEQSTASGSSVTFGSIPAGTKRITIMFEGVSLAGTNVIRIEIGDAGGLETTGYSGQSTYLTTSASTVDTAIGFTHQRSAAGNAANGTTVLTLKDVSNFTWVGTHSVGQGATATSVGGGVKSLSAELTQLRIYGQGSNFDAGSIAISYE
jgi:hypothetical protein